jgi:hypothetical protein
MLSGNALLQAILRNMLSRLIYFHVFRNCTKTVAYKQNQNFICNTKNLIYRLASFFNHPFYNVTLWHFYGKFYSSPHPCNVNNDTQHTLYRVHMIQHRKDSVTSYWEIAHCTFYNFLLRFRHNLNKMSQIVQMEDVIANVLERSSSE